MKVIIITGTSQGLGSELYKELSSKADKLITINRQSTGNQEEVLCDLRSKAAVERAARELINKIPASSEILFVLNAGEYGSDETISDVMPEALGELMYINVFSQLTLMEYLIKAGHKLKIVGVSSRMGSVSSSDEPFHYAYSASKASLSLCVRLLQQQYPGLDYMLVHPGWMQTRMGGQEAPVNPKNTARFIVNALDDPSEWNAADGMIDAVTGGKIAW